MKHTSTTYEHFSRVWVGMVSWHTSYIFRSSDSCDTDGRQSIHQDVWSRYSGGVGGINSHCASLADGAM